MHVDRPTPSPAYLALLGLATLLSGMPLFFIPNDQQGAGLVVVSALPLLLLAALDIGAFFTRYRIEDGNLIATAWPLFRKTVPLADIRGVQRVGMIRRVLGWSIGSSGCCNRLTNGLAILLPGGVLYISPSDTEMMESMLRPYQRPHEEVSLPPALSERNLLYLAIILMVAAAPLVALGIPMLLGLVPPNGAYGVRTTQTFSDPAVWYIANARGGWCMVLGGLASVAATLLAYTKRGRLGLGRAAAIMVAFFLTAVLGAAVLSLLLVPG